MTRDDAPDRIWIEEGLGCPYFYDASELAEAGGPLIEYIRADLAAPAPVGREFGAELSGNTGGLIDRMAEAIRGDTTSDDTPWAVLPEDRKIGWHGDAERALAVVKEYLTAHSPAPVVTAEGRVTGWQPIETAPRDRLILVYYDHDADPYQDPRNPNRLTDYATWAEGGDFLDGKGICLAKWFPPHWESVDEYGGGYQLPAWWFAAENDDFERVVNPTHWMPIPDLPAALLPAGEGE